VVHHMKAIIKPTWWSKMTYCFHCVIVGVPSHTCAYLDVVLEVHNNMMSAFTPINLYGHMALIGMRMNNCIVRCIGSHYSLYTKPKPYAHNQKMLSHVANCSSGRQKFMCKVNV
jgi:hypothetical protein